MAETKMTKSEKFRKMYDEGKTVGEIAKATNSHYSFVYGVLDRYTDGNVRTAGRGEGKSEKFREMYKAGKTVGEIAKETNSNYSFVFSVIKKYRKEQEKQQPKKK